MAPTVLWEIVKLVPVGAVVAMLLKGKLTSPPFSHVSLLPVNCLLTTVPDDSKRQFNSPLNSAEALAISSPVCVVSSDSIGRYTASGHRVSHVESQHLLYSLALKSASE